MSWVHYINTIILCVVFFFSEIELLLFLQKVHTKLKERGGNILGFVLLHIIVLYKTKVYNTYTINPSLTRCISICL